MNIGVSDLTSDEESPRRLPQRSLQLPGPDWTADHWANQLNTPETCAIRGYEEPIEILNHDQRPNSVVGTARLGERILFFKQRPREILLEEVRAIQAVKSRGYTTPELVDLRWNEEDVMMLQEFIPSIASRNLTHLIEGEGAEAHDKLRECFRFIYQSSVDTLTSMRGRVCNDRFLADRASAGGRIETLYSRHTFSLCSVRRSFTDLLASRFVVDGTPYRETFGELLDSVKKVLSTDNIRPVWFSHGDIVETNIYECPRDQNKWGLIDLEVTGTNWAVGDIVIPLVGLAYMFDYTLPKYKPDEEHGHCVHDKPLCSVIDNGQILQFENVNGLHSSSRRAEASRIYIYRKS